jgi:heme exporter protein A
MGTASPKPFALGRAALCAALGSGERAGAMSLRGRQVTVSRGEHRVIDGLDFDVSPGSVLVLTGANGAGKTTLLRAIAGLLPLAGGAITLGGHEAPDEDQPSLGERCHFVGHLPAINGRLTVAENLAFWQDYLGVHEASASVQQALEMVGLDPLAGILADRLSAGQKRRLALARIFAVSRPLWLLDEPTTALDKASSERLLAAINAHTANGGMAVVATHQPLDLDRSQSLDLSRVSAH